MLVEEDINGLDKNLTSIAKSHKTVYQYVKSCDDAIVVRQQMVSMQLGIVRVEREFLRGYDLKFAQDSFVLVVANGTTLLKNELEQVISRGSRSQGIAKGLIVIQNSIANTAEWAFKGIEARVVRREMSYFDNLRVLWDVATKNVEY